MDFEYNKYILIFIFYPFCYPLHFLIQSSGNKCKSEQPARFEKEKRSQIAFKHMYAVASPNTIIIADQVTIFPILDYLILYTHHDNSLTIPNSFNTL